MNTADIIKHDKELNDINNQLLDIAHKLKVHNDLEESDAAIMKITSASKDIHNIRIKLISNGVQQK